MPHSSNGPRLVSVPSDIEDSGLRNLYGLWEETRTGTLGPADLDQLDFPDVTPRCTKYTLASGQPTDEAIITYEGAELVRTTGEDITGARLGDLERYVNSRRLILFCGDNKTAVMAGPESVALKQNNFLRIEHICLPLSKDGESLSGFLYAVAYLR